MEEKNEISEEEYELFKEKYGGLIDKIVSKMKKKSKKTDYDELIKTMKSPEYLPINFNDSNHKNYILKLSKRNNYHYETIGVILNKTMPPHIISILKSSGLTEKEINEKILEYDRMNGGSWGENENYKGLFIIKNKKVIGYTVFCIDETNTEILFILIDKDYQREGIGSKVLNYVKEILKQSNEKIIMACIDKSSRDWYLKNGFISEREYYEKLRIVYPKEKLKKERVFYELYK
jgi:ribosomal protein S18 acetylase RimI-like enzyme